MAAISNPLMCASAAVSSSARDDADAWSDTASDDEDYLPADAAPRDGPADVKSEDLRLRYKQKLFVKQKLGQQDKTQFRVDEGVGPDGKRVYKYFVQKKGEAPVQVSYADYKIPGHLVDLRMAADCIGATEKRIGRKLTQDEYTRIRNVLTSQHNMHLKKAKGNQGLGGAPGDKQAEAALDKMLSEPPGADATPTKWTQSMVAKLIQMKKAAANVKAALTDAEGDRVFGEVLEQAKLAPLTAQLLADVSKRSKMVELRDLCAKLGVSPATGGRSSRTIEDIKRDVAAAVQTPTTPTKAALDEGKTARQQQQAKEQLQQTERREREARDRERQQREQAERQQRDRERQQREQAERQQRDRERQQREQAERQQREHQRMREARQRQATSQLERLMNPYNSSSFLPQYSPFSPTHYMPHPMMMTMQGDLSSFRGSHCYTWNGNTQGPMTRAGLPDMRYSVNRR